MFIKRKLELNIDKGGFMKVNVFKEFLAGFFTTFFIASVVFLAISGGMFKCGFTCVAGEKSMPLTGYVFKSVVLAACVGLLYLLWRNFDQNIIAFPLLVFNKLFMGELSIIQTIKILVALFLGSFLGIWSSIYIFSVLFISQVYDSSVIESFSLSDGQISFDSVFVYLSNELRSSVIMKSGLIQIGYAMPYLFLAIMFALFFDSEEKKVLLNTLLVGAFTFVIYLLSGDLFLNGFSFVLSVFSKTGSISETFNEQGQFVLSNFILWLRDDISLFLTVGLMSLLVAVCGLFIGHFIKKEIFEIGRSFDEPAVLTKKPATDDSTSQRKLKKESRKQKGKR